MVWMQNIRQRSIDVHMKSVSMYHFLLSTVGLKIADLPPTACSDGHNHLHAALHIAV
jgi:hypothetical protein